MAVVTVKHGDTAVTAASVKRGDAENAEKSELLQEAAVVKSTARAAQTRSDPINLFCFSPRPLRLRV